MVNLLSVVWDMDHTFYWCISSCYVCAICSHALKFDLLLCYTPRTLFYLYSAVTSR